MQDGEVRKAFERSLKKQGFKFKLNTKVRAIPMSENLSENFTPSSKDRWEDEGGRG